MPTSSTEGKDWLLPRILAELPGTVLDVGAGEGTYAKLIIDNSIRAKDCEFIAIEVYEPYIEQFGLKKLYDQVIIDDARTCEFPEADVVILGDIIEHLRPDHAKQVWDKARRAARRAVLVSMPLGRCPQGAVNGNEHERHVSTWSNATVHALGGVVASWTGQLIGVYAVAPA